jgi:hypothetical protein
MNHSQHWKQLCEAVLNESDPERLIELVGELNDALEQPEIGRRYEPGIAPEARGS